MDKEYLANMLNDYIKSSANLQNVRSHKELMEYTEEADFNLYLFMNALEEEINTMINDKIKGIMT